MAIEYEVDEYGNVTKYNKKQNNKFSNKVAYEVDEYGNVTEYKPTLPTTNNKKESKKQKDSFFNATNMFADTIKNSAVVNHGLNLSNVITDAANIYDASKEITHSLPFIGKPLQVKDNLDKTVLNTATNMGEGALRTGEGILDTANSLSDKVINGVSYQGIKALYGKERADKWLKEAKESTKEFVKKDLTTGLLNKTGYNDEKFHKEFEQDSLVKRDNLGGQVAQGVGGMVPSLLVGQYLGLGELPTKELKGLHGLDKAAQFAKNLGMNILEGLPSTTVLANSTYGQSLQEAYQNGATEEQATKYAIGSTAKEIATEWITGGIPGLNGTGGLDKPIEKLIDKTTGKLKNEYGKAIAKSLMNYGYKFIGEGLEEGLSEIIDPYLKNATYSKDEKVNLEEVINSFIIGGITGGILEAPNSIAELGNNLVEAKIKTDMKKAALPTSQVQNIDNNVESTEGNPLMENKNQVALPVPGNALQNNVYQNDEQFVYEPSENIKVDNFRKSVNQFMNNSNETKSFANTVEKVIKDKNYNITFDNTIGENVNGRISINENGEVDIRINPNSDRAGEFILTHEITHAIDNKEMRDLVIDYASKNSEFNNALESLKETYGVEDVNDEVLADISGQLFGNEEFINKLSTTKPNIFKRIYDKIISFANKITGNSKESLFIKDLKNKWEKAYRDTNVEIAKNNLKDDTKYMITGKKGATNLDKYNDNKEFINILNEAKRMEQQGKSKKQIRKETGWYKDVNGDWKFEISDKAAKLIISPKKNTKYSLNKILKHDTLYKMYPKLENLNIVFKDIGNSRGAFNKITKEIYINNNLINDYKQMEKTILHELQHNIQHFENFQAGTSPDAVGSYEKYKKNFGETEARETSARKDMSLEERINTPSTTQRYSNNSKDKLYTKKDMKWYNLFGGKSNEEINIQNSKNNKENLLLDSLGGQNGLENSSFSFDQNAKQYEALINTDKIEFYTKENGDIKIILLDSNSNAINDFSSISEKELKKQLGEKIGEYINNNSTSFTNSIILEHNENNKSIDEDYKISHRPSEDYGNASNFENNMTDIFEHPEWYLDMSESYNRESLNALRKVRNNPEGPIKIYRATPGDIINPGDWVTPSKKYAQEHLNRSLDGNGNIIEMTVKAKDILFAGDDINEFGYFPDNIKYSKEVQSKWQEHLEQNYKSKGTRTYFENTRLNNENDSIEHLDPTKESSYGPVKKKGKIYNLSKVIEFNDYNHQEEYKNIISNYDKNTTKEQIKADLEENFKTKRSDFSKEIGDHIKYLIGRDKISVSDELKVKFSSFSNFVKNNAGDIKFSLEGKDVIEIYNQLNKKYPSVFENDFYKDIAKKIDSYKNDYSVDVLDQLENNRLNDIRAKMLSRMAEFIHEDPSNYEKYKFDNNVLNLASDYIYDAIQQNENVDDIVSQFEMSPKQIRKEKTQEFRDFASQFIKNSANWVDKKIGLSYKVNTMKRNFYEAMGKIDGENIYHNFIEPIFIHNKQVQDEITKYNEKIKKLKLSDADSVAVQMFGELKYNPETLVTQMEVDDFIEKNKLDYKKIENAAETFRTLYDELIKRENQILSSLGFKTIDYREGYFPHFVESQANTEIGKALEKIGFKFDDSTLPTDIAGITDQFKPGKIWNRNAQQRIGKYTDYNALKGFDNYIRNAMNTIYFTEDIQKLRALENEIRYQHSSKYAQEMIDKIYNDKSLDFEERQEQLERIYTRFQTPLNNLVTELRDYTNNIANKKSVIDRSIEQMTSRNIYTIMNNVNSRISANMVGLNLSSAITNFIPITQAMSQVKPTYLLRGLAEAIKTQVKSDNFESKSVFLTTRLNEAERLSKTRLEKISDKMNFLFNTIDSITSNAIVRGKYYENKANKMSEYDAMRNADEFARDLMAGRAKGEMPTIFNSKNPLLKPFTAFQLEVNNQYQYMFKDMPRDLKDEGLKKLLLAYLKMYFGAWAYNQLSDKLVGRKSAFSPADTVMEIVDISKNKNLSFSDKATKITKTLTQDVPFIGGVFGGGRLPISSALPSASTLTKSTGKLLDEKKENNKEAIIDIGKEVAKPFLYVGLPFGGGQLKKTLEGTSMYLNNKEIKGAYTSSGKLKFEAKKDPLTVTKNILFGQSSSKEAQEYYSNGYAPIPKNTLDKLKKQNISIDEFRTFSNHKRELGINEMKSDKDSDNKIIKGSASAKKALAIMNSNYSTKEKDYLLSTIAANDDSPVTSKEIKDLKKDDKTYKFYFGLNDDGRKKFRNELKDLSLSSDKIIDYYNERKNLKDIYTSDLVKEKMMTYVNNLNTDEKTKWYLYNKDYGDEHIQDVADKFNLKFSDYNNVVNYSNEISIKYKGSSYSSTRKKLVFDYINNLKISKIQKCILYKKVGYNDSTCKNYVFDYIDAMNLDKYEKKKLFEEVYK